MRWPLLSSSSDHSSPLFSLPITLFLHGIINIAVRCRYLHNLVNSISEFPCTEKNRTEPSTHSDEDRGYSRSGFYFLPFWCSWARPFEWPISSRRTLPLLLPRVCRFIASRSIRDNCCWSISDVCTERDTKSFFPLTWCVSARAVRTRGRHPVRLFYYVRNFSTGYPCARDHRRTLSTHV